MKHFFASLINKLTPKRQKETKRGLQKSGQFTPLPDNLWKLDDSYKELMRELSKRV